MMKYFIIILIFAGFVGLAYAQSDDHSPSGRDYVSYTENYNVKFTHDGNIAFFPMNYCPYCGEQIEYKETVK